MRITRNKMGKKYSVLIILVTFVVLLNIGVLGALNPQPSTQIGLCGQETIRGCCSVLAVAEI